MEAEQYRIMFEAEENHWWYRSLRDHIFSAINENCLLRCPVAILDAGCGTGYNLKCLDKYGLSFGVDISESALEYCSRRGLVRISKASVMQLPFPDESFDLVLSSDVLYHEKVRDDSRAIGELCRVLKKSGILIVNVPAFGHLRRPHDGRVHAHRRYKAGELELRLKENGFDIVDIRYRNMFLYPVVLLLSMAGRVKKDLLAKSDLRYGSGHLNELIYGIAKFEKNLGSKLKIPFGTSVFCVARKGGSS